MSDTAIVILAAGGSVRMGRPKQLLPFAGVTLMRRAAQAAIDSGCGPIVVVLGAHAAAMRSELAGLSVEVVINDNWARGIGSSIRRGIAHLAAHPNPPRAAMLMLCDQPLVTGAVLRRLLAAHGASGKLVTVSTYADTLGPPVIVNAEYFPALLGLPDAAGAKAIWTSHPEMVHHEPCPEAGMDVDTPEDYERAMIHLA
jgi:molybdenum cofactor cytidylyltransferase